MRYKAIITIVNSAQATFTRLVGFAVLCISDKVAL